MLLEQRLGDRTRWETFFSQYNFLELSKDLQSAITIKNKQANKQYENHPGFLSTLYHITHKHFGLHPFHQHIFQTWPRFFPFLLSPWYTSPRGPNMILLVSTFFPIRVHPLHHSQRCLSKIQINYSTCVLKTIQGIFFIFKIKSRLLTGSTITYVTHPSSSLPSFCTTLSPLLTTL